MPRLLALVLATIALFSCAGTERSPPASMAPVPSVLSLVGRFGIGHACPVNGMILTAAHVAYRIRPAGPPLHLSYAYSAGDLAGFVSPKWAFPSRDIAVLELDSGDAPRMNPLAERAPRIGERVHWYEYDLEAPGVLEAVRREKEITSVAAGHGSIGMAALPGASGTCAFDRDGRVVGLVIWRLGIAPRWEGIVVFLTGDWWPGIAE